MVQLIMPNSIKSCHTMEAEVAAEAVGAEEGEGDTGKHV